MMTRPFPVQWLALVLLAGIAPNLIHAQTAVIAGQPAENVVGYQIGGLGANQRVWQKVVQTTDAQGNTTFQTNQAYVELASGLNYWDAASRQWLESKEEIDAYAGGAIAQFGQHKVIFAGNLNAAGAIDLQTPDGKELQSHVLGLGYYDTASGKSVLIAEVKDCQGQIVNGDEVVYADVFDGASADVRYTYLQGSFEQDVILKKAPPKPEAFGLNSASTVLQVLTEFDAAPAPNIVATKTSSEADVALPDEFLDFGVMQMVPGRAFVLGQDPLAGVRVAKQWLNVNGRIILTESVRVSAIAGQLKQLAMVGTPRHAVRTVQRAVPAKNSPLNVVSAQRLLPAPKLAKSTRGKMKLAKLAEPETGLVLDYVTINTGQSGYTFQGDTTYYISGALSLSGTTTFEGGAVLKYATNASLNFYTGAQINWQGTSYHPVILTAKLDGSVGETITRGTPSGYYANPALSFNNVSPAMPIANFRIAYAQQAISLTPYTTATFNDGQLVNCANGIFAGISTANLRNLLFANVLTGLDNLNDANVDAENVTFAGNATATGVLMSGYVTNWNVCLTNCIIANCEWFVTGSAGILNGAYNGFYNNNAGLTLFGDSSSHFPASSNPFQTVGAGYFYLAYNCAFTNAGTTNIDSTLLASLAQRTVYPPLVYSNVTLTGAALSPQALRDAGGINPLGYHYDPLDYLCTQVTIAGGAPTTLTNASVGLFGNYGLVMSGSSGITSQGQPNALNHVVWYPSVQEQPVLLNNIGTVGSSVFNINNSVLNYKNINFSFTEVDMQGYRQNFMDTGASVNWPVVTLKDCQMRDVFLNVNAYPANGAASASVTLQNDLWERCTVQLFNGYSSGYQNPLAVTLYNNTFWSNTIALSYMDTSASSHPGWTVKDNLFDGDSVSFSGNGSYPTYIGKSNNAHNNTTMPTALTGTGDVSLTSLTYAIGPWGNRYIGSTSPANALINAGSRPASAAGLTDYTIFTNQFSDIGTVDIGFHYVATADFWIAFLGVVNDDASPSLYISSPVGATGTVTLPGLGETYAFSVAAGAVTNIDLDPGIMTDDYDVIETNGIHITASQPVSVYGMNNFTAASAAFTGYPAALLGTNYCVMARPADVAGGSSEFAIVATMDGTTVWITPSPTADLWDHGTNAYSTNLDQGETYQIDSSNLTDDVTGTLVTSDKPVGVFAGASIAFVPDARYVEANPLVQEQLPVDSWGTNALALSFAGRLNGDSYRVLAANGNTVVTVTTTNGVIIATNKAGQFFDAIIAGPVVFQASQPIQVAHFANSATFDSPFNHEGDPCEILLPPTGHYLETNTVFTPTTGDFDENYMNIIVSQWATNSTFLDSALVASTNFVAIGTNGYYGAQITITSSGAHTVISSQPVGVEVYGFGYVDAYGYFGGIVK
jgi:hypothetical protein